MRDVPPAAHEALVVALAAIGCLAALGLCLGIRAIALVIRSTAARRRNHNRTPGGNR